MNRTRALAALLCVVALSACDENAVQEITGPEAGARIKFFNFGVNAPGVNFYANDVKFTAISSTSGIESTTGVAYGSVGSGGLYGGIAPGTYTLTGKIAATVDKDLVIATQSGTLENGKAYSYFMSGFYNTTAKTSDGFLVEDAFSPTIDYAMAYVRFVNASSNASPMQLIATSTTTATLVDTIGGVIAYKGAGAFEAVLPGVYNLATRYAATTTNAIARTGVSFVAGRVYTIGARGDMTVTSTTATNRPFLDNTANR
ncbi:MAG: DUF4397 domain-containing protein [Gemmatimonadetes bacterium]|nr:DUF4397 domain-containing protein [Gemmatimonadota bacterium]